MSKKRDWESHLSEKQRNLFQQLMQQAHKVLNMKNTHGQAYRGVERYLDVIRLFAMHLAASYGATNFRNVRDLHLISFIEASLTDGIGTSTLKSDLSAIRKFHSLIPNTRYSLSSNEKLGYTDTRTTRGIDRAWEDSEYEAAIQEAKASGNEEMVFILQLGRVIGLRIAEATKLTRSQIINALANGFLHVKGKGGVERDIPLNGDARALLIRIREYAATIDRERIFIQHGRQHHEVYKSVQNWILYHRNKFQQAFASDQVYLKDFKIDEERPNLTFHGLRHAYAREQYIKRIRNGMNPKMARLEVAELLGHGRDDVTRVYLGKLK